MNKLFLINSKPEFSFTLIEIIVVVTIISLLLTGSSISYKTILNSSFDTKRKTDIEEIRVALEIYRNNNSTYPTSLEKLTYDSAGRVYLKKIPKDPKTEQNYSYLVQPTGCNENTIVCTTYKLTATLENGKIYSTDPYGTEIISP